MNPNAVRPLKVEAFGIDGHPFIAIRVFTVVRRMPTMAVRRRKRVSNPYCYLLIELLRAASSIRAATSFGWEM